MPAAEKVIFANDAATVHILIGDVEEYPDGTKYEPHESRVLEPGETIKLDEVTSYLREAVKKGEAPGLALLTVNQAKKLQEQAKIARNRFAIVEVDAEDDTEDEDEE